MLLDELVGAHQSVADLRTLVRDRAGGVPFFIEEIILDLVDSGRLRGETGKYELSRETTELTIPDSVQAVIAARIDRLAPDLKALLRAAAVLGTDFSFDRLRDLSTAAEGEIGTALRDLKAAHFILEVHGVADARYNFVHALTHEVAYEGLPLRMRQQLHASAFESLRQIDTVPTSVEELAHHAERGALWPDAVMLLRKSGTKALGLSAYRNAHEFFERAQIRSSLASIFDWTFEPRPGRPVSTSECACTSMKRKFWGCPLMTVGGWVLCTSLRRSLSTFGVNSIRASRKAN
jgi:predicted ATPase